MEIWPDVDYFLFLGCWFQVSFCLAQRVGFGVSQPPGTQEAGDGFWLSQWKWRSPSWWLGVEPLCVVGAPCTGSQILLTARLASRTILSAGSTPLGEFGPGLGSSIWRGLQNQEPGSHPNRIPRQLLGALAFPASILAGHRQLGGLSYFPLDDLSPSRGHGSGWRQGIVGGWAEKNGS